MKTIFSTFKIKVYKLLLSIFNHMQTTVSISDMHRVPYTVFLQNNILDINIIELFLYKNVMGLKSTIVQ